MNHQLSTLANAGQAYNVIYSVTPAFPAGPSINASTAKLTGSAGGAL